MSILRLALAVAVVFVRLVHEKITARFCL